LTPFHPISLRAAWLNKFSAPILNWYGSFPFREAESAIAAADLFVFDSDHGLFLVDRFKALNSRARFVYRVSDHIPMLRHHPLLPKQERRVLDQFDVISVPSAFFQNRFADRPNVLLQHHGLQKELFDQPCANPYRESGPHVIFVGQHHFDHDFLVRASRVFPEWQFHIFGNVGAPTNLANVHVHGERPFAELVPYLKHADIGLQAIVYTPGAECFTDSLKMQQYTYCRLPIVAPAFLGAGRPHVFCYQPGDDASIKAALLAARGYDRTRIDVDGILSWDQIAMRLAA
jgi:2-beta-glucuronyltransferase